MTTVADVTESGVAVPVGERLHNRSLTGLLAHAPAEAPQTAVAPLACTVHARFAWTTNVTVVREDNPVATSMSLADAVSESGESGDELGETVSARSAGLVIVAGLSSDTAGEHLPDAPVTLHVVTVWARSAPTHTIEQAATRAVMRIRIMAT